MVSGFHGEQGNVMLKTVGTCGGDSTHLGGSGNSGFRPEPEVDIFQAQPQIPTSTRWATCLKGSVASENIGISWVPNIQIYKPVWTMYIQTKTRWVDDRDR